ncbi:MAG: prepilin-type N-terminal cleavage/methylation domain-containing protein [Proteobacteria bacterium]|nr:prepilin-type N-terminal cleavage/methylation domain-containing protein [Pseudomonadota bacterium]
MLSRPIKKSSSYTCSPDYHQNRRVTSIEPSSETTMACRRGFTLIELIVVMVIISLALAIVLPRLTSVTSANLKSDAVKLSALVRYLHEAAESKKLTYRLSFDLDRGTVGVERSQVGRSPVDRSKEAVKYVPEPESALRGFALASGVEFVDLLAPGTGRVESGTVQILLSPAGSMPFTVHLGAGEDDRVLTLGFNPYNGKIVIEEGYK